MRFHLAFTSLLAAASLALVPCVEGKHVFAHYLVGTVTQDHAQTDINDALAAGISGFSLNIGDPSAEYVIDTLNYMFDYAPSVGFLLHISMDVSASGGDPNAFNDIVRGYVGKPGYFAPSAGKPFVTTFSDGGQTNTAWDAWKLATLANDLFFCPDFDGTAGYL
ncbi:glycoside hydrolase family 71 protein [Phlebiopsis gigantea 11061_1 CR5-6]|uniref:Glycoside hydrolase family 71 protein n=1 Tax=Phlebiopsis gigantea (strain 11061_1 CR5-6) TaxID=745531 RepID=A0A0C3PDC2_PHLG1|nr:glycoside hydrolase family 71 protein [Phlebiopsis gigantea 11061_1 CR5-6]